MAKITVFRWHRYDIQNDEMNISRRLATADAIKRWQGEVIGTGIEIDEEDVGSEVDGMTVRDYRLGGPAGFQTRTTV